MPNMHYCRFQNTAKDLHECYEAMDEQISEDESRARRQLINLCRKIADDYTDENGSITL